MSTDAQKEHLVDPCGRTMRKLRLSIIDSCNFRCFYCMPEQVRFTPKNELLSPSETGYICSVLASYGIEEIRITGGEPTLRSDLMEIIWNLSELPLAKLGLTTNGFKLAPLLKEISKTKCRYINFSLDSLNKTRFEAITRTTGTFDNVYKTILDAHELGFKVKINVVALRNVNEDEILDFVAFSARHKIEVRFLEFMNVSGQQRNLLADNEITAQEIIEIISKEYFLTPLNVASDSTAICYKTDSGARIGIIASETRPFCSSCSRLRLNAIGDLYSCLMSSSGVSLHGQPAEAYPVLLKLALKSKPGIRGYQFPIPLYKTGG